MDRKLHGVLVLVISACLWLSASGARAETEVDLALVLAVDVSRSMDPEEQELQRQGFIEAFRSPLVHDAIRTACSDGSRSPMWSGPAWMSKR
jgi:uncharacterized protein DUF1194